MLFIQRRFSGRVSAEQGRVFRAAKRQLGRSLTPWAGAPACKERTPLSSLLIHVWSYIVSVLPP